MFLDQGPADRLVGLQFPKQTHEVLGMLAGRRNDPKCFLTL